MQNPYVENRQYNQVQQPQQYGIPPASTAGQRQLDVQQFNSQSNSVQIPNQSNCQQPLIISQIEGKKKKKNISVLNVIITVLAIAVVVGVIYLGVKQCMEKKQELDTQKATEDASNQKPELTGANGELCTYTSQDVNNNSATNSLNTVNQTQSQSTTIGS